MRGGKVVAPGLGRMRDRKPNRQSKLDRKMYAV